MIWPVLASYYCYNKVSQNSDLSNTNLLSYSPKDLKPKINIPVLKSGFLEGYVLSGGSRTDYKFLPFIVSLGCPHSLAYSLLSSSNPAIASSILLILYHSDTGSPTTLFFT